VILWFIVKFGLLALCHESHIYIYKKKNSQNRKKKKMIPESKEKKKRKAVPS